MDKRKLKLGLIAVAAAFYVLSPIDALPDFIVLVGWLDDLAVLLVGIASLFGAMKRTPQPALVRSSTNQDAITSTRSRL